MNFTNIFKNLWLQLFGSTEFMGLNVGFWVGMIVVALIVVIENIVFWSVKPKKKEFKTELKPKRISN